MSGAEITATFKGAILQGVYSDGGFFTEEYRADGTIDYHDGASSDAGTWSVKNDNFCTFYEGREGGCFFVRREGENCFSFHEQRLGPDGKAIMRDDWTGRGWLQSRPSTCTEATGDSI